MTHQLHSDHCKCECDLLAKRVVEIVASMKSNNGTHDYWVTMLEEAVDDYDG